MNQQQCPICKAGASFYCSKPPAAYFRCAACGTIFQHPMPSLEEMIGYAEQEYSEGLYGEYVRARDLKYATFRKRMREIGSRAEGTRLIDVGCSCGYFMDVALESGFDAYGVEFSSVGIAAASERARARITHGDVNQIAAIHKDSYDVITAFDIIEHLLDPVQFLINLRGMLAARGLLVITTPDTSHFLRLLMRSRWPMLQPLQHTCLFSRDSLRRALKQAGYRDIEILPARKALTLEYLAEQIKIYNPLIARSYNLASRILPSSLRNYPMSINISEVMAFARRGD